MATITKRGETYLISVSLGYDTTEGGGYKQRRKTLTFRPPAGVSPQKGRKLAEQAAMDFERKVKGLTAFNENMKLCDLWEWYNDNIAENRLRQHTLATYAHTWRMYIEPTLGNAKLKDIAPARIDALFMSLYKQGSVNTLYYIRPEIPLAELTERKLSYIADTFKVARQTVRYVMGGNGTTKDAAEKIAAFLEMPLSKAFRADTTVKGLAGSSVEKVRITLTSIFNAAVKAGIMKENPVKRTTRPPVEEPDRPTLTPTQSKVFIERLSTVGNISVRAALFTALFTGLRSGELRALTWDCVNLDTGLLHVKQSVYKPDGGEYIVTAPKTKASVRIIPMLPVLVELLGRYKEDQRAYIDAMGTAYTDRNIVFANRLGNYLSGTMLNLTLKDIIKGTDIPPGLHCHSLRHSFASLAIAGGTDAATAASLLGHSNPTTTLEIYTHAFAEQQAKAMQAVNLAIMGD